MPPDRRHTFRRALIAVRSGPPDRGRPFDDIDAGTLRQTPVYALADLVDVPCLVLLGQAGMGKTHAARAAVEALLAQGQRADFLSLGREPDPDAALSRLLRSKHRQENIDGSVWHIFLNGAAGPPTRVLAAIESFVAKLFALGDRAQLRLRFLYRTAAWSATHDRMVEAEWADDQVRKLELARFGQSMSQQPSPAWHRMRTGSSRQSMNPPLYLMLSTIMPGNNSFPLFF